MQMAKMIQRIQAMLVASREKEREMRWWRPGASAMGVHFLRNKKGESGNHSSSENQTQCARNNPQKVPLWPYHPQQPLPCFVTNGDFYYFLKFI